ncbi:AMP-binding protein [Izhakiella australiensis]|uniref:AMP-binding protein n=1 Tax=Izhakiella australiensis TaxID=1926881 RepID=A0A1S8YQ01_9GAMM|nr:AMP-binding protein [Izhakiella australiensis]OON40743.1 AMP-binding protein [Izhakiella australiensis]
MTATVPLAAWLSANRAAPVAIRHGKIISQQQLRQDVQTLCCWLSLRQELRWALCFEQSYDFLVALLATLHSGKVPVIPGHLRPALLNEQRASFDAVLSDIPLALEVFCQQLPLAVQQSDGKLPVIMPDATLILFTSGSTGAPREVVKPVACLDEEIRWLSQAWGERLRNLTVISSVSHQHLYGLTFRIMLPMALGLTFHSDQIAFSEQLSALARARRYLLVSSPAFLRRLDSQLSAPPCALVVSAGGELCAGDAALAADWLGVAIDEIYGSSETGIIATRRSDGRNVLWQPFAPVRFSPAPDGRWRVQSPLIASADGMLLDDRLHFDGEGFSLAGRYDRIVKIEDKRVSLSDVERRLMTLPGVHDAAVLVLKREGRSVVGAVLVIDPSAAGEFNGLRWRQALRPWLEPVAIPRYWRTVDAIPLNSQSKRDWHQLEELFNAAR